jgi:hypothetical protein
MYETFSNFMFYSFFSPSLSLSHRPSTIASWGFLSLKTFCFSNRHEPGQLSRYSHLSIPWTIEETGFDFLQTERFLSSASRPDWFWVLASSTWSTWPQLQAESGQGLKRITEPLPLHWNHLYLYLTPRYTSLEILLVVHYGFFNIKVH